MLQSKKEKMKKIITLAAAVVLFIACSTDDNKAQADPIFSQPYTKLESLDDLELGKYQYMGNKLGDRNVGLVGEGTYCKQLDYLLVAEGFSEKSQRMEKYFLYNNFRLDLVDKVQKCVSIFGSTHRVITDLKLIEPGLLRTDVNDGVFGEIPEKHEEVYDGVLEIGFQAGFLRIEDRMSDYNRVTKDEKVYLYFKKI